VRVTRPQKRATVRSVCVDANPSHRPCVRDAVVPIPGPGQVLLAVEAASVEGGDVLEASRARVATILGYQCAGRVVACGAEVDEAALLGRDVVALVSGGAHAEYVAAPAASIWLRPAALPPEIATCVPIVHATAALLVERLDALDAREILVTGASGAVGAALLERDRARRRYACATRGGERVAWLRSHGADDVVAYDELASRRFDAVVDLAGGPYAEQGLRALSYRGTLFLVGNAAQRTTQLATSAVMHENRRVEGFHLRYALRHEYARVHALIVELLEAAAGERLRIEIDRRYPLPHAAEAYARAASTERRGRVVLSPISG
jgi:NADPH2:quinone reductase